MYDLGENRVGFYCEVTCKTINLLIKMLMAKADHLTTDSDNNNNKPDLFLYVRSLGGSISSALAAYDHITSLKKQVRIVTVAEGHIASCGTLIFLAGEHRLATRHSTFLFHQLSTTFSGTYTNLRYELKECTLLMDMMRKILLKRSNLTKAQIISLFARELVLPAKQCRKMGIFRSYY